MRAFSSVAPGEELPRLARTVTPEDVKAYADAGGDHNPLHQDDAFARSVGFPGIIAHGMFTMGHMAACAVAWAGSAGAIAHIAAQFRAPVYMGDTIIAGGRVRSLDVATRTVTLETWVLVERDGGTEFPVRKGEVTLQLA
jgi:acyl dehydratase